MYASAVRGSRLVTEGHATGLVALPNLRDGGLTRSFVTDRPGSNGFPARGGCSERGFPGSCSDRNTPSPEVLSMRFSYCMVPEVYQLFWAAMARGEFITDAAVEAGTYRKQGTRWLVAAGGVRPRRGRGLKGRCLTLAQREEIALGRARGQSVRSIAAAIRRSPSTVSRELRRNADRLAG